MDRRVVLRAAAGLSAAVLAGLGTGTVPTGPRARPVAAQEVDGTRARELVVADQPDFEPDGEGWIAFRAEFPFWAVGIGWDTGVGRWPVIELQISEDGERWGETWRMAMRAVDDGKLPEEGRQRATVEGERLFTDLLFAYGEEYIRFRPMDGEGNLVPLSTIPGLLITYIDPTDGPWEDDRPRTMARASLTVANEDTIKPPQIITRAQWGADESLRFDRYGEIWPPEYETVEHAIVHHAAVNYGPDGYLAVRSIYHYHCVTQGWGDIGYNYLVDLQGNIYEGRVGGQNVIGGHAFQYAIGSSGICIMGDFQYQDASEASKAALATILAFVTRDLDTMARKQFHEVANLPTICGHRDVVQSTCPGQVLYNDLPRIRQLVADTLKSGEFETGKPAGIVPGDQVKVQTDDGNPLNMRSGGSTGSPTVGSIPDGTLMMVIGGPTTNDEGNWYRVDYKGTKGWVLANYLVVTPLPPPPVVEGEIPYGTNIRITSDTNIRRGAGTNHSIIGTAARNTWAFIMGGPVSANGYEWYQLRVQGIGDGWAFKNYLHIAEVNENPNAKFKVGDSVSASRAASVRVRAGAAQTVAASVGAGTAMKITVAPIGTTDAIWYGVQGSFGGGWISEAELQAAAAPPTGDLAVGDTVRVTETLNMRTGAGTGYGIIATLAAGTTGKVVNGPLSANGYTWYQIQTNAGTGWVARNWIAKTTPPPPAQNKFAIGDTIRITETMNRRSSPGGTVIGQFTAGATGKVLEGPRSAMGYTWWRMETTSGTGWGAQDWAQKTAATPPPDDGGTPPPSGKFANGDTVRVTEALNMRTGAGTGNGIIATLPAGTTGTVVGGPSTASGYTWWQIRTSSGTGWAAQDWLAKSSSGSTPPDQGTTPPPSSGKFSTGQTVRVTEALNIRTGAGTGNGIVTTLPAGTTGKVLDGPRSGSGYTWWRIETSRGTGWAAQDWLAASSGSTPPSGGAFKSGDSFRVTEALNMRSAAGTGNRIVATLPAGTTGSITGTSQSASGYTWWPVRTNYGTGWVAQDWIRKS